MNNHIIYPLGEVNRFAPDSIKDRNGVVVLALCYICGRAESELSQPCCVCKDEQGNALNQCHECPR